MQYLKYALLLAASRERDKQGIYVGDQLYKRFSANLIFRQCIFGSEQFLFLAQHVRNAEDLDVQARFQIDTTRDSNARAIVANLQYIHSIQRNIIDLLRTQNNVPQMVTANMHTNRATQSYRPHSDNHTTERTQRNIQQHSINQQQSVNTNQNVVTVERPNKKK